MSKRDQKKEEKCVFCLASWEGSVRKSCGKIEYSLRNTANTFKRRSETVRLIRCRLATVKVFDCISPRNRFLIKLLKWNFVYVDKVCTIMNENSLVLDRVGRKDDISLIKVIQLFKAFKQLSSTDKFNKLLMTFQA